MGFACWKIKTKIQTHTYNMFCLLLLSAIRNVLQFGEGEKGKPVWNLQCNNEHFCIVDNFMYANNKKEHILLLCFVDRASLYNPVNEAKLVHNFSQYVYFFSLHVSGDCVPIIRRNNSIYATLDTCYAVCMTVWYAGCTMHTSHLYRVTNTQCRIETDNSPDDGHTVARNMYRKEINILRKIVLQVGFTSIYKIILRS